MIDLAIIRERMKLRTFVDSDTSQVRLASFMLDDIGMGGERPVVTRGSLYAYDDELGVWGELDRQALYSLIQTYDGQGVVGSRDTKPLKLDSRHLKGIYECALSNPGALRPGFFDSAVDGIAFRNGFVRVTAEGITFTPPSPDHRATAYLDFDYDPAAECPEWIAVNRRLFELDADADDKRRLFQEFIGACVAGVPCRFARCLVMSGGGNNGKNVVADIISEHLFPPAVVSTLTPQSWAKPEFLSRLRDSRLNVVNEMPANDIQAGDVFKAVVDGNSVTAKDLYAAPYTMKPRAGHLFLCNSLPGTRDNSHGFWRRMLVLEFKRNFSTHPDESGRLRTKDEVKADLLKELPGIMLWALHGAVRLLKQASYTIPASHHRAMSEWRMETDQVAAFVDDACKLDGGSTLLSDVHREFCDWCEVRLRQKLHDKTLAKRLRELGVTVKRGSGGPRVAEMTVMMRAAWGTKAASDAN
jgi:P4 family phage/plasmid primase-like protien